MVRDGFAWHYRRFDSTPAYAVAEAEARRKVRKRRALPTDGEANGIIRGHGLDILGNCIVASASLCGLAASLALFALQSRLARDTFARMLSIWCSLTAFGRFAVCSFLLIGILIGGDKTNSVPPNMNSPLPQMQHGGVFLTGFTGLTGLHETTSYVPSSLNLVNLVNPVQTTPPQQNFAERKAANCNVRGA